MKPVDWEIHTTHTKEGNVLLTCGPVQVKGFTITEALANLQEALTRNQELYEVIQQHFTRQEDEYSKWIDQQYAQHCEDL